MREHIESFISKLEEGIAIGEQAQFTSPVNEIQNIVITGLGGSGIGGSIASAILHDELKVPVTVVKDYFLPAFVNKNTLVIACSYSGNTEETLQTFDTALKANAKIVCVTSGGKILELAKTNNCDFVIIPGGMPPRACFPYSFTQIFYVLKGMNLISNNFEIQLKASVELLKAEEANIISEAKILAQNFFNKIPVIFSEANYEGVCVRFRQQINENSKMVCWHAALPEMNHNELVGWVEKNENLAVVFFRNDNDFIRTQKRMEIVKQVCNRVTPSVFEVWSKGNSMLEKTFYLVLFGDWVSLHLAELKGIDAKEVKVIDFLKSELAKI